MRSLIIIISFLVFSCNSNPAESDAAENDSTQQIQTADSSSAVYLQDTLQNSGTSLYVWLVDFDKRTKKRNPDFKKENLHVDSIIKGLNELYPDIKLDKVKISGDTLFTEIKDSEYLGERMGSSGAAMYIADAVINLTAVNRIKYVKINFEPGSHASPGVWSVSDFSDYKVIH